MILKDVFCPLVVFTSCSVLTLHFKRVERSGGIDVESVPWKGESLYSFLPSSKAFAGLYPELVLPGLQTEALY